MDLLMQTTESNPHLLNISIARPDWTVVGILNTQTRHLWIYDCCLDLAPVVSNALNIPITATYDRVSGFV